jgi:hypothetical protein
VAPLDDGLGRPGQDGSEVDGEQLGVVCVIFRGRRHDTSSERRMREDRTSGATSGD